jgi:thymidylate synthase (FAD)
MKAELIDYMGTDDSVVDSARVSFDKQAGEYTTGQNIKLINYLAKHNHFTPFTHPQITMREKVPIFVARQRFKHTVGFTYNEVSRRYVDDEPEFYIPDVWRSRPEGSVKQGSGYEAIDILPSQYNPDEEGNPVSLVYQEYMEDNKNFYKDLLLAGVAPEQARMVLPQSMYTEYYVTGSLAAWARAYKLRIDSHSQKEIQDLAKQWKEVIAPLFPASWAALTGQSND